MTQLFHIEKHNSSRVLFVPLCMVIVLFLSFLSTGCTSMSIKIEPRENVSLRKDLPVKFNFSTISWNTANGLPGWFNKEKISILITKIKEKSPELFSEDKKAMPLTFFIEHTRKNTTNGGLSFLCFLTLFTIPTPLTNEDTFNISIRVGDKGDYSRQYTVKTTERMFLSFIPFLAFLMPAQRGYFCHGLIGIDNEAINKPEIQNIFLNMIYGLDSDKLRKMHDDKFEESIELLGAE